MKMKVQAQFLRTGDIVGSGETVICVAINSINMPKDKIFVSLNKDGRQRNCYWGKYTEINIERA